MLAVVGIKTVSVRLLDHLKDKGGHETGYILPGGYGKLKSQSNNIIFGVASN